MTAVRSIDRRSPEGRAAGTHLVRTLSFVVFLQWLGAGAFLPLFPIFLRDHGASTTMVGIAMGSYFVAGLASQYPAGRLADRIGRRPILIFGLVAYGGASFAMLFAHTVTAFALLRAVQGFGSGAVEVASLAMVAVAIAPEHRGRAFGSIYSAQLTGTVVGPLVGALAGLSHMGLLFSISAIVSTGAALPVLIRTKEPKRTTSERNAASASMSKLIMHRASKGSLVAAFSLGLLFGTYEAAWSLLLHVRGGSSGIINISWILFSIPFALAARPGGRLADRADRRVLATIAIFVAALCCVSYPFLPSIWLMLVFGTIDALCIALALPSAQSLLTEHGGEDQQGRLQGLYSTSQMAATSLAALCAGALFSIASWVPFVAAAGASVIGTVALAVIWKNVAGKVSHHAPDAHTTQASTDPVNAPH